MRLSGQQEKTKALLASYGIKTLPELQEKVKCLMSQMGVEILPDMTGPVDGDLVAVARELPLRYINLDGILGKGSGDISLSRFAMYCIYEHYTDADYIVLRGYFDYTNIKEESSK